MACHDAILANWEYFVLFWHKAGQIVINWLAWWGWDRWTARIYP
ncbi:hypothetical protein [Methanococcoides alaskense]|uniref:Uncharacterized protein n=1 Tax=Methanococcoides alaskense TaxID=325778 RepID=A0AA90U208_9EURY|nr:hypothetical protein [Methanococcoides alaskense]MDA0524299.1 hypothetical protein [Methanococcoides alaskense]MDR6223749.1 hypothetical protein [Methanococcoides alaskense]